MPRKTKNEELKGWLKGYQTFLAEVNFVTYQVQVCVIADSYTEALEKLKSTYPKLDVNILQQVTQIII